jgi:hypothetical protein
MNQKTLIDYLFTHQQKIRADYRSFEKPWKNGDIPQGTFQRVVCWSDAHGDLGTLMELLHISQVMTVSESGAPQWIGGQGVGVVIVGDLVDRHRSGCLSTHGEVPHEEEYMFLLLNMLDLLAYPCQSAVFTLIGNHEVNQFLGQFANTSEMGLSSFGGSDARLRSFQLGIMNDSLRHSLAILRIGSLVFVHGGLSVELVRKIVASHPNNFFAFVNHLWHTMLDTDPQEWRKFEPWCSLLFLHEKGILWNRDLSDDSKLPSCDNIRDCFEAMGFAPRDARRMTLILGHTPQIFRCFAQLQEAKSCAHAGYTLNDVVYQDGHIVVKGGKFVKQRKLHGMTFFCLSPVVDLPQLCLVDISQSRAFDWARPSTPTAQYWYDELQKVRAPTVLDIRYLKKRTEPFFYLVQKG